ncbi:hypothetical protein T4D_13304 [Trichinella pseudospiralis]|uniref:Uncharacterized protein n=1 Tax=Trichinella pseudospiralis TaxID=6337 RepID=A0A0V1F3N2_TRIPS|nr:hypothetical protein T4D_13304 [Trichinella pseudospiralis]
MTGVLCASPYYASLWGVQPSLLPHNVGTFVEKAEKILKGACDVVTLISATMLCSMVKPSPTLFIEASQWIYAIFILSKFQNIDYHTTPQSKTSSLHSVWTVCSSMNNFEKNLKTFS